MAYGRPRQSVGPEGLSHDHDDADLSRHFRRARREEYVGPWLPERVVDTTALAPDTRTELAEDLSIALLLTLDRLSPLERATFLLHDVFDFSFSEVAAARSEARPRAASLPRARAHVRVVTDGGGKGRAALNVIDGADRAAQFLVSVTRKGWREDFHCALRPSTACPVPSWTDPTGWCRLRRSRLRTT